MLRCNGRMRSPCTNSSWKSAAIPPRFACAGTQAAGALGGALRKIVLILAALLSLPILLFVYQPSLQLGYWAFVLGNIGRTLSPLILFGALVYVIVKEWDK